jgi:hypothetical protein
MSWVIDHLGLIIFLAIAYSVVRKVKNFLRQAGEQTERHARMRPIANVDPEEAQRVRQIQEEIRRKIAERRGGDQRAMGTPRTATALPPPLVRPAGIPPTDPFGGGAVGRAFAELERRMQPAVQAEIPPPMPSQSAQLERQMQLAEQLRVLEETRALTARRATQTSAALKTEAESGRGMRAVSRGNLLADLRDARSLRRAFVLREVLGPPVGLHRGI